jgi:hypothetical protein
MTHTPRIAAPALLPIFRYWVIGLVLLITISPTDIPASHRLYLALVYSLLFFYPVFNTRYGRIASAKPINYTAINLPFSAILLAIQFAAISISTQFYTGSSVITAFAGALAGENTYSAYQTYFADAQFAATSPLTRVVYIVLLALAKVIFVFSVINFFLSQIRRFHSAIFMMTCCVVYVGFGLARGTFFEVFEVACSVLYFWFMTSAVQDRGKVRRLKTVFYSSSVASLALIGMFFLNIARRYGDSFELKQCTQNFCYNPVGIGDMVEYPIYLLTGYFGNGGYFISSLFETTLTRGEFSYLIPMQSVIGNWGSDEFGVRAFMCEIYVACRFVWTPEVATLISVFGILAIPIANLLITYLAKLESLVIRHFSIPGMLLLYFAFMLAISLPSANFFTVSSPSILAATVLIGILARQKYGNAAAVRSE